MISSGSLDYPKVGCEGEYCVQWENAAGEILQDTIVVEKREFLVEWIGPANDIKKTTYKCYACFNGPGGWGNADNGSCFENDGYWVEIGEAPGPVYVSEVG